MEMNEILNGLNSSGHEDFSCNSGFGTSDNQGCTSGVGGIGGLGGSWIWILLILFYTCSGSRKKSHNHCCDDHGYGEMNESKGGCSSYLFLLVLLFLCNGNRNNNGAGGLGNIFGCC